MDSKEIIERWGIQREGQLRLWEDYDQLIRITPFRSVHPDFDREVMLHFWMHVYKGDADNADDRTDYEIWKSYYNPLCQLFEFARPDGWLNEVAQPVIQLSTSRKEPLEDHMKELHMWLPHCKYITNSYDRRTSSGNEPESRKALYISVLEHTLGSAGIYNIWMYNPGDCELGVTRHGRYSMEYRFASLEATVAYIRRRHWYTM